MTEQLNNTGLPRACCHCYGVPPGPSVSGLVGNWQSVCHLNSSVLDSGNCISSALVISLKHKAFLGVGGVKERKRKEKCPVTSDLFSPRPACLQPCSKAFDGPLAPVRCYVSASSGPQCSPCGLLSPNSAANLYPPPLILTHIPKPAWPLSPESPSLFCFHVCPLLSSHQAWLQLHHFLEVFPASQS